MHKQTTLPPQYYESFAMLDQLVQRGHQLHDQAIFDFGARWASVTARLVRKAFGMGAKRYGNPVPVQNCR